VSKVFRFTQDKDEGRANIINECIEYNQSAAQLRTMLREAEFNALWSEGNSMTMSR